MIGVEPLDAATTQATYEELLVNVQVPVEQPEGRKRYNRCQHFEGGDSGNHVRAERCTSLAEGQRGREFNWDAIPPSNA